MADENKKKTGMTPVVESDGLGGGKVEGVLAVTTALVKYTDGHGKTETKLAVVIPGGEVYFLSNNSIDMRPAQTWLKEGVQRMVNKGSRSGSTMSGTIEITEDTNQV